MLPEKFGTVESVNITILVDNAANLIVDSNESVKYFTNKPLLAEHGFSALVHFPDDGIKFLWDAGVTRVALMENLRRMEIEPTEINKIAISHGHFDHYAALSDLLSAMDLQVKSREWEEEVTKDKIEVWVSANRLPVIIHPAALRERWWVKDDGTMVGPLSALPKLEWEALGAEIKPSENPYPLGPGCWTTGYIPRESFERSGRPTKLLYREGNSFKPDDLEDDQAVVIHLQGKGLIVLSGCAHAGIVNTIEQARRISGVDRVHAVIGGFHLARSKEDEVEHTIDAIKGFNPEIVVPCHCTGFGPMCAFSQHMPDSFVAGVVGATYAFA
jgi:7,8-dihydropterin-6-yl-methyl-4-(beta-D-ribofuranosyl)aminobenzene 5'-phosphate synthase